MTDSAATTAAEIVRDETARHRVQRRILTVVVISQVLGGAGLAAGITVGALLAEQMLGSASLAGLPSGLFTLGSALSAFLVGRITQRLGRGIGLGLGFTTGGLGAIGVIIAAVSSNVVLLFISLFVYGAGTATNLQARYAGTDLALPTQRGRAVSVAMVSTTLGAVAGPNLVEPLGTLAEALGIPVLAGPFLLAAVAYLAAGTVLVALLRPDPYLVAQHLPTAESPTPAKAAPAVTTPLVEASAPAAPMADGVPSPADPAAGNPATTSTRPALGVRVGATVMVLTQIAMAAIMTMTPVHMRAHGHEMGAVGMVIGIHIAAMYLPSLVTGALVDRVGRVPISVAAGVTLLLAGLTGALVPGDSLIGLVAALALLGLGWNFGLIAGTALIVDATTPATRARTQGNIDVLIALSGAGGGAASGVIVAGASFATLSLVGGVLALVLVPAMLWYRHHKRREAVSRPAARG